MSAAVRAAARAEVAERRHLTTCRQRIAAIERALRQIMVTAPFGAPPREAVQLTEQLHIARNCEAAALRDWQSARRVARMARMAR